MIPYTEFSKGNPIIHFAHANGYPSKTYGKFLQAFIDSYGVIAMDARPMWEGAQPSGLKSWNLLASDMAQFLKERGLKDVIGMGHSMGGVASLICAANNPGLFRQLILIDPVIIDPKGYLMMKMPSFIKNRILPMIKIASRRKYKWESRAEAIAFFKSKKVYARFDDDAFTDFIEHGLKEDGDGLTLAYTREWESKIYSSLTNVWPIIKNPPCPLVIVRAQYSDVMTPSVWPKIKKTAKNTTFINVQDVGHMMPMEKPELVAQLINEVL